MPFPVKDEKGYYSWYHLALINKLILIGALTGAPVPDFQATFSTFAPRKICSLSDLPSLAEYGLTAPAHCHMQFCWLQSIEYVRDCQGAWS